MRSACRSMAILALAVSAVVVAAIALAPRGSVAGDPGRARIGSPAYGPAAYADVDRVIADLEERLGARRNDPELLARLGHAYLQKQGATADPVYLGDAADALTRSVKFGGPDNFEAYMGMGLLSSARHDFHGTLRWGRRAARADPYSSHPQGLIGDGLLELGRYRASHRAFTEMIGLKPDLSSYARIAYEDELLGRTGAAARSLKLARDSAGSPGDAAWASYQLGELYFGQGRPARAEHEYRRGAFSAPESVLPRVGFAKLAAARGSTGRAVRIMERVVAEFPSPEFTIMLGDLYRREGNETDARDTYRLARAIHREERKYGIDTALETAVFDADHGGVTPETIREAREGYLRRPNVQSANALAWTLHSAGKDRLAWRRSREALRLGTRSAIFHFHAGAIAQSLGMDGAAHNHLRRALSINPHFSILDAERAEKMLASLEGERGLRIGR